MFISWLGQSAVKIEYKSHGESAVLLIDPYKVKGEDMPKSLATQVVLLTRGEKDTITFQKDPYVISKPGEYETASVSVFGFANPESKNAPVVYRFSVEGVTFAHLGMMKKALTDELVGELDSIDVLLIPVGGHDVLFPENAGKMVTQIEPRMVIPICYKSGKSGKNFDSNTKFLKELGATSVEPENRVRLRKQDLPSDSMQTIVLTP